MKFAMMFAPLSAVLALTTGTVSAQICPFDDGNSTLTREGLILTRFALGLRGADLVANTDILAADAPTVEATVLCPSCGLDINGNGGFDAVDATIISRKIAGFSGAALTTGLALGSGSRNTPLAVQTFLLAGCGATGGTVTSVTAGAGLLGGIITASGTIAADTAYLQRRVSATCPVGSSIRVIAADGTVTCQTDNVGGTGGVSSVATGLGLTGGPITATGTINLATTQLMPTTACATNQIPKWNGTAWACAADGAGSAGTVTSVATGAGLSGGPINTTGTITLASTQLLPTAACAANQIAKWSGSAWFCAADATGGSGTVTSVATGAGLTGGPIATTGTINLAATQLMPTTACAANQIAQWSGTAWLCTTPLPPGTGTVTGIATGVGLTGGPITTAGTINLQASFRLPQTCSTDQIIKWSGTAWVCTAAPPVFPTTCTAGQYLTFDSFGAVQCSGAPTGVTRVDTIGTVGSKPSVAIGIDGLPIISYYDQTNTAIKVAKCANASCSGANLITQLAVVGTGFTASSSIAVPANGRPVISFYNSTNADLMFIRCASFDCASGGPVVTLASVGSVGTLNSIAISPVSGFPVIAYVDQTALAGQTLNIVVCGDADCSPASNTTSTVDGTGNVGLANSVVVPADGFPVISYYDVTNKDLKVAKCSNAQCTGVATITSFDVAEDSGGNTSIAIGGDGLPVVAYGSGPVGLNLPKLKVLKCGTAACNAAVTIVIVDGSVSATSPKIAVGADGLPVISYYDATNAHLRMAKCGNASCSGSTITQVDSDIGGQDTAIAIPADGLPVIAYFDQTLADLKVFKCANAVCRAP